MKTKSAVYSYGKSFMLLLRSVLNTAAFAGLWYGLAICGKPGYEGEIFIGVGALLSGICLSFNLFIPLKYAKK